MISQFSYSESSPDVNVSFSMLTMEKWILTRCPIYPYRPYVIKKKKEQLLNFLSYLAKGQQEINCYNNQA